MTRQFYFELSLRDDIATGEGNSLEYGAIAGRRISRRKKLIREREELLLEKCKNDFVHCWVETNFWDANNWADIVARGCTNVTKFLIIFVTRKWITLSEWLC